MSRSERSRSPHGELALPASSSRPVSRSFDLDKMELTLGGQAVKVYRFADDPEMPWFQAKPIVTFLGYKNITQTLEDYVYPEDKSALQVLIQNKGQPLRRPPSVLQNAKPPNYHEGKAIYVNESGLYSIILSSRMPMAKPFKCWVTQEVLPAIRRTGGYSVQTSPQSLQRQLEKREGAVVLSNNRQRRGAQALDEARLDWVKDFHVDTDEVQGVKAYFTTLLHVEIQKKNLPGDTRVGGLVARPPLRFRELALAAVSAYRQLYADGVQGRVQQNRQSQDAAARHRPGGLEALTDGRQQHVESEELAPLPEESVAEDDEWREQLMASLDEDLDKDDDILKVSEVMRAAGVSRAVWLPFRSDLSNKLLALKCEQTQGAFSERRPEVVGSIPVSVHKYKKSQDWPLAWQAVQKTQHLYQKRVRECLEAFYHLAGIPIDPSIADLARRVAEALRTH